MEKADQQTEDPGPDATDNTDKNGEHTQQHNVAIFRLRHPVPLRTLNFGHHSVFAKGIKQLCVPQKEFSGGASPFC